MRNFQLGDLKFNILKQSDLVNLIEKVNTEKRSACIFFWGAPMVVAAKKNHEYRDMEEQATICAADGKPVVTCARRVGLTKAERCGGPDIMNLILSKGLNNNTRHYFYGSTVEVLKQMEMNLKKRYPKINIVGMYSPPFRELTEQENEEIIDLINKAEPDYLWVSLGAPKQEKWMLEHRYVIKNTKMMGVGAAFNFFAGTTKRAPKWMQNAGIEWLYRLCKEPKHLWKRYFSTIPSFIKIALFEKKILEAKYEE